MTRPALFALVLVAIACLAKALTVSAYGQDTSSPEPRTCENHLVSIAPGGAVTAGSKKALVDAVESGHAIRVGFGLGQGTTGGYYLTHWIEAHFLTVLGENVFTQTPIIHRQRPDAEKGDMTFPEKPETWVGTIGTNGLIHSRFLESDTVGTREVASWWCLAE